MSPTESSNVRARLDELLGRYATLELATSSAAGEPWLAAAYFAPPDPNDPFTLVMMLEKGGRTLANIRANPRVAMMFQTGDPTALFAQADGAAHILPDDGEDCADRIVDKTPDSEPLVRLPHLVAVRVDVDRYRLTDLPNGWLPAREIRRDASVAA